MLSRLYCSIYGPLETIGMSNFISLGECPPYILLEGDTLARCGCVTLHWLFIFNSQNNQMWKIQFFAYLPIFLFWIKDSSSEVQTIVFYFQWMYKCLRLQIQPRFSTKYLQLFFMLSYTKSLHCTRRKQLLLQKHKLMFYCNSIFFL